MLNLSQRLILGCFLVAALGIGLVAAAHRALAAEALQAHLSVERQRDDREFRRRVSVRQAATHRTSILDCGMSDKPDCLQQERTLFFHD